MRVIGSGLLLLYGALLLCCKNDEVASKKELAMLEKRVEQLEETRRHPPLETPIEKVKNTMGGVREWAASIQS